MFSWSRRKTFVLWAIDSKVHRGGEKNPNCTVLYFNCINISFIYLFFCWWTLSCFQCFVITSTCTYLLKWIYKISRKLLSIRVLISSRSYSFKNWRMEVLCLECSMWEAQRHWSVKYRMEGTYLEEAGPWRNSQSQSKSKTEALDMSAVLGSGSENGQEGEVVRDLIKLLRLNN